MGAAGKGWCMESEILFYLLEQPRSVSDMIRALTRKELSDDADERAEQIPRIAGNWFKEGSGYLWRLQEEGKMRDVGRKYAVEREWLVDTFLERLGVPHCFDGFETRGREAPLNDAYASFLPDYRYGDLWQAVYEDVFQGERMAGLFAFDTWASPLFEPVADGRRILSRSLVLDFWSSVHLCLISSILVSRHDQLTGLIDTGGEYFHWRNRRDRLEETTDAFREKVVGTLFPAAEREMDGTFTDDRADAIASAFGTDGPVLPEDAAEVLAHVYLLSLEDGVGLFRQYSRYDHDVHLLYNLLERGWLIDQRTVERDERFGNVVVPLGEVQSYLDAFASLFRRAQG